MHKFLFHAINKRKSSSLIGMSISYREVEMMARNGGPRGRPDTIFSLSNCYNSENYLTEVDNKAISAPFATLEKPQEDYSGCFDEFVNLALYGQEERLNPSSVSEALLLYLHLLEKIGEI